ncbi:hypothetical protein THOD04_80252 [Vibrio owensii]|nr:hypothetical protein THOD04_80252 [Vibrio owensii]
MLNFTQLKEKLRRYPRFAINFLVKEKKLVNFVNSIEFNFLPVFNENLGKRQPIGRCLLTSCNLIHV